MANIGINHFVTNFTQGGYRPSLFEVIFPFAGVKTTMLCKTASLPAATLGMPDVSYMGRKVKLAGDREFASWTTDFYEDLDFVNRAYLEKWHDAMNKFEENTGFVKPIDYLQDIQFNLLSHESGNTVRSYKMYKAFPTEVGEIAVGYDQADTVAEFSVTWEFNWWQEIPVSGS